MKNSQNAKASQVIASNVLGLLKMAALAGIKVSADMAKLGEKRKGAYVLYVEAANMAKSAEVLEVASDQLFAMIRTTGKIDGKAIGAKLSKDEATYQIPSAISSAKSVMSKALTAGLDLTDEAGEPRSFGDIRKEVQDIAKREREAGLTGIDLVRVRGRQLVAELSDLIEREGNAADLEDLMARVNASIKDYGFVSAQDAAKTTAGEEVTQQDIERLVAAVPAAIVEKARKATTPRRSKAN